MAKKNIHLGSSLDDLLEEEGLLAEAQAIAIKRVLAWKLAEAMKEENLTKSALAKTMNTSRSALDRLLDPDNPSVTLLTMEKAAAAIRRTQSGRRKPNRRRSPGVHQPVHVELQLHGPWRGDRPPC